ncbi:MAG TPA: hypothetical protein VH186_25890 [Chloroflexia bacterium]|nr:hypothetical protein [Chloroflexia bacterium]
MSTPQEAHNARNQPREDNSPQEKAKEAGLAVEQCGEQVISSLEALNKLIQLALVDSGARSEAQRLLGSLAQSLVELSEFSLSSRPDLNSLWQLWSRNLPPLILAETEIEEADTAGLELSDSDLERRLSMTIPPHLRIASNVEGEASDKLNGSNLRRVVLASLDADGTALQNVNKAATGFPLDIWSVTNLGANVPIMALTGTVMELKPSVLVLVLVKGQHLSETIRLVADLKRQLFGIRVLAVGPFLQQANLAERIRPDLFSADPSQAAELADQFFNPLNRLGDSLKLKVQLEEQAQSISEEAPASDLFSGEAEETQEQAEADSGSDTKADATPQD